VPFIAGKGRKIIAGDFAQMELRAGGHISNDRRMIEAFRNGTDLHALTAAGMLRKPVEEVTKIERSHAKPINFGALFGEGARGLEARRPFVEGQASCLRGAVDGAK
jgi:DNA polymerase-1